MFTHRTQLAVAVAVLSAVPAWAGWVVSGPAEVSFKGKTTPTGTIVGTTQQLKMKDDGKTLTFTVPLATVKTGIDLRDNHMHEKFLQVAQHPNATLEVAHDAIKVPTKAGESSSGEATGTFTVHGQSKKDVKFKYTAKKTETGVDVTGSFNANVNDHGIKIPSYLGVTMKPEVVVEVSFQAYAAPDTAK